MNSHTAIAVALLYFCICTEAEVCLLNGKWQNLLGSNMTIEDVAKNGLFTGVYLTAVSDTNATILQSPLVGYHQLSPQPTFGFAVQWSFTESTTVWTGQCYTDASKREILYTSWLLRSNEDNLKDNWKGTRVGYDIFFRIQ